MSKKIEKVAILGAGVMGAQIAAHLSNAGISSLVFDMSQELAEKGVAAAAKLKPAAFYNPKTIKLMTPCNYEEHLGKLSEVDWVVEVIAERLDWKQDLYKKIIPHLKKEAVLTSNTSGIAVKDLSASLSDDVKRRFFITHFFNPPRYMKLVEFIPGEKTDEKVIKNMALFMEDVLGKGVVYAKDTPNFVANRIGVMGMMLTLKLAQKYRLNVSEVDSLTGGLIGHPKSATFRTADVVGLDTLAFVSNTAFEKCETDEVRDLFEVPSYLTTLIAEKRLGQKTGAGFYKKVSKGTIHALNLETLEYEDQAKRRFDAVRVAKSETYLPGKLKALVKMDDVAGKFSWELLAGILNYSANRIPEIADDIVNIDRAMRWGFGWTLGPFETWDAIGIAESVEKMKSQNMKIPAWVSDMLRAGFETFYGFENGLVTYYDPASKSMKAMSKSEKELSFNILKKSGNVIKKGWSASLIDLNDGVAGVQIHSVLQPDFNPLDGSVIEMYDYAVNWVKDNGYKGLVIGSEAMHFTAGANLNLILNSSERKAWDEIEIMSKAMQDALQGFHLAPFPVVAAPHNLALGGGYETIGAADRIVASAELYTGLVEVGVGLIPGAGGNLRMILKLMEKFEGGRPGPFPLAMKAFEAIGFAKVSTSAKEAVAIGYLTKSDKIIVNADYRFYEAKAEVLVMAENYATPVEHDDIFLPGAGGRFAMEGSITDFVKAGKISEHDGLIAKKLAMVLSGGEKASPTSPVSEQYLLDIEREAFISLCGEAKSLARIEYMLKKGKPLRN